MAQRVVSGAMVGARVSSLGRQLAANGLRRKLSSATPSKPLAKTALYNLHLELGGKMVPFADYHLPVQYEGLGVLKEHLLTRAAGCASVFDVGHMGQIKWHGKDAASFLEKMVVGDIKGLKPGEARLSLIMNEQGTIVDDTVITNAGDHIYMVVNGACKVSAAINPSIPQPVAITQLSLTSLSGRTWSTSRSICRGPGTCAWSTWRLSSSSRYRAKVLRSRWRLSRRACCSQR